jgi:ATP-binding cassette, subfamily F, member 3
MGTPVEAIRVAAGISETEARRFLHRFLFTGDGALTPVARLSYGERRRLSLARLVLSGANLLLLDEPTNHLDIPSREAFESALDAYDGAMIAVTHDRYFIDRFAERLLLIDGGQLRIQLM